MARAGQRILARLNAEGADAVVEGDVDLAVLDPVVEPRGAEHELAQPVDRILAAECPLFTPKNKAKLREGVAIATKAITSLKTSTDKSALGLAYYVRGLLYANLEDVPAARSDLQKAAQLGNQDAIDLLNGG
jgi:hypothetical protein